MINLKTARIVVVATTCVIVFIEWLLCELVRLPYRPPHDMNTFLGTEKYSVPYVIAAIAMAWAAFLVYMTCFAQFTLRDFFIFMGLCACLAIIFGLIIAFPMWTVSPPELIWG